MPSYDEEGKKNEGGNRVKNKERNDSVISWSCFPVCITHRRVRSARSIMRAGGTPSCLAKDSVLIGGSSLEGSHSLPEDVVVLTDWCSLECGLYTLI